MSSTFLDMQRERDVLVRQTFPALRAKFRARGVELLEVDLRWGITQEQSESGKTLPTLLAEIDRCRPYFIGLLGERYGWVPPASAITDELRAAYPSISDVTECSVTELEIIHGVLRNPDSAARALFFERDLDWDWMATLSPTERSGAFIETAADQAKLADLKASIRARVAHVELYRSPDELGQAVLKALGESLDARFPEVDAPDAFEQTARLHRAYARERRGLHIGAGVYRADLDQWMSKPDAPPLLITGESGGGKSTLVANWLHAWRRAHPGDIVFEHYLGASPDSADPAGVMRRLWEQLNRDTGESVDLPAGDIELMDLSNELGQRLAQANAFAERKGAHILIALDGLDKLSSEQNLRWLPNIPRVKLVASSLDGEAKDAALARDWTPLKIKPLDAGGQSAFIASTLKLWGKSDLPPARKQPILAHPLAGLPLFLKTVLDELRVSATHARLEERLGVYLGVRDLPDLFARVLTRLEDDCEPGLVAKALPLIWASRAGLEEREIIAIADATPLAWATLRNGLSEGLYDQLGRVSFSHDYIRRAVEMRYTKSETAKQAAHLAIANRFDVPDADPRQAEELPYQLHAAKAWARLRQVITERHRLSFLFDRGFAELNRYWQDLFAHGARAERELCEIVEPAGAWSSEDALLGLQTVDFLLFGGNVGQLLDDFATKVAIASAKHSEGRNELQLSGFLRLGAVRLAGAKHREAMALFEKIIAICQERDWCDTAVEHEALNQLAVTMLHLGELPQAEAVMRALLDRGLAHQGMHAQVLANLALVTLERGRFDESRKLIEQAMEILQPLHGPADERVLRARNGLALAQLDAGEWGNAEGEFTRLVALREESLGSSHPDTLLCKHNLAEARRRLGNLQGALQLFREVTIAFSTHYGDEHEHARRSMRSVAAVLMQLEQPAEAYIAFKSQSELSRHLDGEDHPNTLALLNNMALCQSDLGQMDEALALLRDVARRRARVLGKDHPDALATRANIGAVLAETGAHQEALDVWEALLIDRVRVLGQSHPSVAATMRQIEPLRSRTFR